MFRFEKTQTQLNHFELNIPDESLSTIISQPQGNTLIQRELLDTARKINQQLKSEPGYVIVSGFRFEDIDDDTIRNNYILEVSSLLGKPTYTDQNQQHIIWNVKPDTHASGTNLTYSQHSHEADLHTDTQYFPFPENAISLWCLHHDQNLEGESILLDSQKIISEIKLENPTALEILTRKVYPFRVPTAFTKNKSDAEPEIHIDSIIGNDPLIRYRKQTINRALQIPSVEINDEEKAALEYLDSKIRNTEHTIRFLLRRGQVVFTDNHRILHGRTSFTDLNRSLLRVRYNFKPSINEQI